MIMCLVIGMVPASAFTVFAASEEPIDAAIIFTDLHTNKSDYKETEIKGIFGALKDTGLPFSSVTSGGDAFSVNEDNSGSNGPYNGYTEIISTSIRSALGNSTIPVNYVWSDHDRYACQENSTDTTSDDTTLLDKTSHVSYGKGADGTIGTADDGNYYVYSLSMGDICSYDRYKAGFSSNRSNNGFTESVDKAIENFKADAAKMDKTKPLLIVSHQPLLDNRNDNAFAEQWFDAINKVAEEMDVAFFFGHNHKYDKASDYYYAKGDKLPVATKTGWSSFEVGQGYKPSCDLASESKTLNFTHMCGGYMEPTSTDSYSSTSRLSVAVAVTIYDDSIRYTTYNKDGVYTGNYKLDETVKRDHAPVDEPTPIVPEGYTLNSIEVVNQGGTKYFVGEQLNTEEITVVAVYTKEGETDFRMELEKDAYTFSGYNANQIGKQHVTTTYEGLMSGFTVEVCQKTFTNDAGDVSVEFNIFGIKSLKATSKAKDVENYSAYVTYDITPVGYSQGSEATVTIDVDTDLFDVRRPVIVLDNGKCIATPNIVDGKVTFTTNHFSEYDVVQTDLASADWKQLPQGNTYKLDTNGITAGTEYLIASGSTGTVQLLTNNKNSVSSTGAGVNNSTIKVTNDTNVAWVFSGTNSGTVTNQDAYIYLGSDGTIYNEERTLNFTNQNNGQYRIYRSSWISTYYLRYNNGWERNSNASNVYLFEKISEGNGGYAALTGQTTFNFVTGLYDSPEDVLAAIRGMIAVYVAEDENGTNPQAKTDYDITGTIDPTEDGSKSLKVYYDGVELGTITVTFSTKQAKTIDVEPSVMTVERDSEKSTVVGTINVVYDDNSTEKVNLTVGMLKGIYNLNKNGTYSKLSVTYGGKTVEGLTLKVVNKTGVNDFPTYPNPGSVDLKKTAKGVDFQNTGIARVELSTSGLPQSKGVDIIVMLDLSSSMTRCIAHDKKNCNVANCKTREEELESAMKEFEETLKNAKNASNIRVAIADFNGFYSSGATARDTNDRMSDANTLNNASGFKGNTVYTGNKSISADAFVPVNQLNTSSFNYSPLTGTNYDYAFDTIYQLGHAIKKQNAENNEERELYVLFMSDGAPNQYNYYHAIGGENENSGSANWNKWLQGTMTESERTDGTGGLLQSDTHAYYFDTVDRDNDGYVNEHRMANAIKGSPNKSFEVVRKSTDGLTDLLPQSSTNNLYTLPGLGATMYSIAFDIANDGRITKDSVTHVLKQVPTSLEYYFEASEEGKLVEAFKQIGTAISYAATNARYLDQMGSSFNLQMDSNIETNKEGSGGKTTTNTDITIYTYPIYTQRDYDLGKINKEDIGKTYGSGTLVENVSFEVVNGTMTATTTAGGYKLPNGTEVVKDETNILVDGIIYGKNFFYNSNTTEKEITLANGSKYKLPAETFYWNIGTINEKKYSIEYTVILDGAMDGAAAPGSYDTNNFAVLYYDNHVGNEVSKSVASPSLAWKGAQVSYAFYLVDDEGKPLYADGTEAPNFLQAYRITQPIVYKNVELNSNNATEINAKALSVLPEGYKLFAEEASYKIVIGSGDGAGDTYNEWNITGDSAKTTYVMGFDNSNANAYSNVQNVRDTSYEYTNTTVYFAVKWVVGTVPDTVVIDYGLDVDVNVMANDMLGGDATLEYVGALANKPKTHTTEPAAGFGKNVKGDFGTATVKGDKVTYSLYKEKVDENNNPINTKGMQMNDAETLAYAAFYDGSTANNNGYYYGDLTVIPATTVYYEDEYVTLKTYTRADKDSAYKEKNGWPTDSKAATALQGEDRPGQFSLSTFDANNVYGYDSAYDEMSTFSMNNAASINVDANQYGTAEFEFYGTGFDAISSTSNTTGTLIVQVYKANEDGTYPTDPTVTKSVDTYYGYEYGLYNVIYKKIDGVWTKESVGDKAEEGAAVQTKADLTGAEGETDTIVHYTWKPVVNDPNALYQVPVMKVDGLTYGKYKVKISALYYSYFDSTAGNDGYDLYLDAIRIYNPAGTTSEELGKKIEDAYKADGEYMPSYFEVRNLLIKANTIKNLTNNSSVEGIIFIDGNKALADGEDTSVTGSAITDYTNFGPNNELYLAKNQAVAFDFSMPTPDGFEGYDKVVRIGLKTVGGKTAMAEMWNASIGGTKYNTISDSVDTATDMYYDITPLEGGTVVITNTGEEGSILSVTNIKTTYKPAEVSVARLSEQSEPEGEDEQFMFSISARSANAALMSLRPAPVSEPEEDTPEVNNPDVDEPEINNPEVNEPEVNKPDTEKPEANKPKPNKPGVNKPETNKPGNNKPTINNPNVDDQENDDYYVDDSFIDNPEVEDELTFVQIIKNIFNSIKNFFINLFNKLF